MKLFYFIRDILTPAEKRIGNFSDTLDYAALGKNWQNDPAIIEAAADLYKQQGKTSPFYQAYMRGAQIAPPEGAETWLHGSPNTFTQFDPVASLHDYYSGLAERNPVFGLTDNDIKMFVAQENHPHAGWFTDNLEIAKDYAGYGGSVYPVYLRGENNVVFDAMNNTFMDADHSKLLQSIPSLDQYLASKGLTNANAAQQIMLDNMAERSRIRETFNHHPLREDLSGMSYPTDAIIDGAFINSNADSVAINNILFEDDIPNNIIAVRNPTQIKSIYNRGTFDPADPDIYRSVGPIAAGGGALGAAALAASEGQAAPWTPPDEPGLESSFFDDPIVNAIIAPVGASAGILTKLGAIVTDAIANGMFSAVEDIDPVAYAIPDAYYDVY